MGHSGRERMSLRRVFWAGVIGLFVFAFWTWAAPALWKRSTQPEATVTVGVPGQGVALGIDVLTARRFELLQGQRVGLLTHRAGVNRRGRPTWAVLDQAPQVDLVALFAPEHGLDGLLKADVAVAFQRHGPTGLPVYSLYGATRRPTPEMLAQIDVLVVDLQDLGTRSYTYISALRYALEACFEAGVGVVVLDRPNPLGGLKVAGPMLEARWESYVGAYPIPYVYGLTIGELAQWAQATPGVLKVDDAVRRRGRLTVVAMQGWQRWMRWPETGLGWVPTSPAIPDLGAAVGYPMSGLGTILGGFKHGYGTLYPFRLLQYPGRAPEAIQAALEQRRIAGLRFQVIAFEEDGEPRRGVYVQLDNWAAWRPTELSFHLMVLACEWSRGNPFRAASEQQRALYLKHVGDTAWWNALVQFGEQAPLTAFLNRWDEEARAFHASTRGHWLYP